MCLGTSSSSSLPLIPIPPPSLAPSSYILSAFPEKNSKLIGMDDTGGHLAFRCAFDKRVAAAVCYFATDIHSHSLGEGKKDDSLERAGDIRGEIIMVCSVFHSHPPPTLIPLPDIVSNPFGPLYYVLEKDNFSSEA